MGFRNLIRGGLFLVLAGTLAACQPLNHHLIHPETVPAGVTTWTQEVERDRMLIHLEWASPEGSGPFPTVLVHPEAGKTAKDMRGVIWDLAQRGYLAVAVDYRRWIKGKYRRTLFPWRKKGDVTASLDVVRSHPGVDPGRIGALGFSQGGVFSLLIAASTPEIRAVVAYYPVTDFVHWLSKHRPNPIRRWVYRVIRWHFRRESGARTEAEFHRMLVHASPYHHAEAIRAPVLLIHGDRDTSASVEESRRLAERLRELGRDVALLVVRNAGHVFNFKHPEKASRAWEATLAWLERHLKASSTVSGTDARPRP